MRLNNYLKQLEQCAEKTGVSLKEAALAQGIARSTVWRWRTKGAQPRAETAEALLRYMDANDMNGS